MAQNKYSLNFVLVLIITSIVIVSISLISVYKYTTTKESLQSHIQNTSIETINKLETPVKSYIESFSINEYELLAQSNMKDKHTLAILIKDFNMGKIMGKEYYLAGKIRTRSWEVVDYEDNIENFERLKNAHSVKKGLIKNSKGEAIGEILVYNSDRFIQKELDEIVKDTIIIVIVTSLVLTFLSYFLIHNLILRPLEKTIKTLSTKNKNGIPQNTLSTNGFKEIHMLSSTINQMIEEVKGAQNKLHDLNENLNEKVKEQTKQIYEKNKKLNEAQHISQIGSWSLDIEENKLEWSDEIFNIFEIKKSEFEPSYEFFLNSIHPEDKEKVDKAFQNSIKNKKHYEIEHRILLKNKRIKYVLEKGSARYKDDKAVYARGTVQDITKEKELKEQIIREKEKAENFAKSKSEFLANMSHEIRTPLNAITGFVDILKTENKGKNSLEYVNIIDDASKSLLQIIEDILDFTKIESGKLEISKIDFNAKKEFEVITHLFLAKCSEKNITLTLDIDDSLPEAINTDPLRIKQIISNLISNAVKFTPNDKKIFVNINYKDDLLFVSVKDEGIGISKDKLGHIFEAFNQEDSSTTRKYGGTGLGLSISSELVKLLGGKLQVNSQLGVGSEFYFSIPAKVAKPIEDIKEETTKQNFSNIKLLLVEDNKANQMFMKVVLKKMNMSFDIANDGIEAVKLFKDNRYDVILMDENMPNMNGIEATKHMLTYEKESNLKHTPIIALTANALKGDRERFLEAGMDEYLAKPLDKNKLAKTLNNLLY